MGWLVVRFNGRLDHAVSRRSYRRWQTGLLFRIRTACGRPVNGEHVLPAPFAGRLANCRACRAVVDRSPETELVR